MKSFLKELQLNSFAVLRKYTVMAAMLALAMTATGCFKGLSTAIEAVSAGSDRSADSNAGGNMTWTEVNDHPFGYNTEGNGIHEIAYGNNRFVAGGENGKMAYSSDGKNWTTVKDSPFDSYIGEIAFGNGTFVTVASGQIATSTDGKTWTASKSNSFLGVDTIAFGKDTFVVVGTDTTATSTDGKNWTAIRDRPFNSATNAIAWGNDMFVAVDSSGKMAVSTDGKTWTVAGESILGKNPNGSAITVQRIAYGNDVFVAVGWGGNTAYSTDGKNWTAVKDSTFENANILGIAFGNGRFIAGTGNGILATSTDGRTWTAVEDNPLDTAIYAIAFGNGRFVAGGITGQFAYASGK